MYSDEIPDYEGIETQFAHYSLHRDHSDEIPDYEGIETLQSRVTGGTRYL